MKTWLKHCGCNDFCYELSLDVCGGKTIEHGTNTVHFDQHNQSKEKRTMQETADK